MPKKSSAALELPSIEHSGHYANNNNDDAGSATELANVPVSRIDLSCFSRGRTSNTHACLRLPIS